jgi:DNA polymerase III subunit chi
LDECLDMTEVDFHFNVPDKLVYACRFLRKATTRGVSVVVVAPTEILKQFDVLLWTFSPHEFVSHASVADENYVKAASLVLLCESAMQTSRRQILLNLGDQVPIGFEQFERLIEIVSEANLSDRQLARERWKHYASMTLKVTRHDISTKKAIQ